MAASAGRISRYRRHADLPIDLYKHDDSTENVQARYCSTPSRNSPALSQRHPLEILEATDIEPCSLKGDKDGRICQRPLGDHQGRSSVVSVRVTRNSSDGPVVSGPSRTSSPPISDAGSHCRRRESGMIFATGRSCLKTSISSPASTRRKTSAVWLRSSRAGMAAIGQVQSGVAICVATPDVLWWCAPRVCGSLSVAVRKWLSRTSGRPRGSPSPVSLRFLMFV